MNRCFVIAFALVGTSLAQTSAVRPTVDRCQKEVASFQSLIAAYNQSLAKQTNEKADLEKQNRQLADQNAALIKQLDAINTQYERTLAGYNDLIEKFNASIQVPKTPTPPNAADLRSQALQDHLAAEQAATLRAERQLAIYNSLRPAPSANVNVNHTDCNKLPALCVNH